MYIQTGSKINELMDFVILFSW